MHNKSDIRKQLYEELRDKHYLWSYDCMSMNEHSLTDEQLIEKVLMHLDLPSVKMLFHIFLKCVIKEVWKQSLCPLEPRYHSTNVLFATIFFDIRNPHRYITTQANQMIRKNTHQYERSSSKNRRSS